MIEMTRKLFAYLLIGLFAVSPFFWSGNEPVKAAPAQQDDLPDEIILDNGFRITFDGVEYHSDATSTWSYTVEELPDAKNLDHWVLETPACASVLDAGPQGWEAVDPDRHIDFSGVKWKTRKDFSQGQFWVKLDTGGAAGLTQVAAKGRRVASGEIAGPTCIETPPATDPPAAEDDTEPPTLTWIAPVAQGETYGIHAGETVDLVVEASDDDEVEQVEFLRYNFTKEEYKKLRTDRKAPYRFTVAAEDLYPAWNYITASSIDAAGNRSEWKAIWIYQYPTEAVTEAANHFYLPLLLR